MDCKKYIPQSNIYGDNILAHQTWNQIIVIHVTPGDLQMEAGYKQAKMEHGKNQIVHGLVCEMRQ